jgi:hypothetical protein
MATDYRSFVIKLTAEQLAFLEALAVQTNSRAKDGRYAYQHSWQAFLRRLGDNEFEVIEKSPYRLPDGLDAAIAANEQRRREQEQQAEHRQRHPEGSREQTKHPQKTPPLKLQQLEMELEAEPA